MQLKDYDIVLHKNLVVRDAHIRVHQGMKVAESPIQSSELKRSKSCRLDIMKPASSIPTPPFAANGCNDCCGEYGSIAVVKSSPPSPVVLATSCGILLGRVAACCSVSVPRQPHIQSKTWEKLILHRIRSSRPSSCSFAIPMVPIRSPEPAALHIRPRASARRAGISLFLTDIVLSARTAELNSDLPCTMSRCFAKELLRSLSSVQDADTTDCCSQFGQ